MAKNFAIQSSRNKCVLSFGTVGPVKRTRSIIRVHLDREISSQSPPAAISSQNRCSAFSENWSSLRVVFHHPRRDTKPSVALLAMTEQERGARLWFGLTILASRLLRSRYDRHLICESGCADCREQQRTSHEKCYDTDPFAQPNNSRIINRLAPSA